MRWFQFLSLISFTVFAVSCLAAYSQIRAPRAEEVGESSKHEDEDEDYDDMPYGGIPRKHSTTSIAIDFTPLFILLFGLIFFVLFILTLPPSIYVLVISHYDIFVYVLNSYIVIVLGYLAGIIFYYVRTRWPLVYGLTELTAAAFLIWIPFGSSAATGSKVAALLGGIYVAVRGFDNIDKGLSARYKKTWDKIFPQFQTNDRS